MNLALISALVSHSLSQFFIKGVIECLKTRKCKLIFFINTKYGGMPSSHAALMSGLTFYLLFSEGMTNLTSVALVTSFIIDVDAFCFRKKVQIALTEISKNCYEKKNSLPFTTSLGHTLSEVIAGTSLGFCVSLFFWLIINP